jgi:hypothetical protein
MAKMSTRRIYGAQDIKSFYESSSPYRFINMCALLLIVTSQYSNSKEEGNELNAI